MPPPKSVPFEPPLPELQLAKTNKVAGKTERARKQGERRPRRACMKG
jgi:hypothetical protein